VDPMRSTRSLWLIALLAPLVALVITVFAAGWLGLGIVFPREPLALGLILRTLRYALAMFWAMAAWPWLFVRLGLGASEGGRDKAGQLTPPSGSSAT
jgi:hypothetical protein